MIKETVVRSMSIQEKKLTFWKRLSKDFQKNKYKYLIILPVLVFMAIFAYKPMYGIIIAFKDYRPQLGIMESKWVGFKYFTMFFKDVYFTRILGNTFLLGIGSLVFGFPVPIIFALLLNEVRNIHFKKVIQTTTYLPHFISIVVLCAMIKTFCQNDGIITNLFVFFGGARTPLLQEPGLFRPIYIISGIWQNFGWDSIIYLAALTMIDPELYEAVEIDGGGRWAKMWHIKLPGLKPTIIILLILAMGGILGANFEKVLNLYNPVTYETADVISTYTYRMGIINGSFSYGTAIGLFNSLVNIVFLGTTNYISKRTANIGLF
ncbi:MAG: ABC transporter permease subunit [Clostridiaceae bacterium]|nr:ABC transporter permease subunit [Clostridiaceae bacterium]